MNLTEGTGIEGGDDVPDPSHLILHLGHTLALSGWRHVRTEAC